MVEHAVKLIEIPVSIIFGLVDLDCPKFFLVSPNETTRGHVSKLFVRQSRVDVRKYGTFLETVL